MTLPLFEPTQSGALTVSQLTARVRGVLDQAFGPVWVHGEICSLKAYQSGHWYFTLRDAGSQVRCCMWRTYASRAGRPPEEGTEVYALATPGLWEEKGEFRLTVTKLLPTAAVGRAAQELERVRRLLESEGLFAVGRKRPLPEYARAIAVVTSPDGAALRDVISVVRARWPLARLLVVGTRVQGEGAPAEICRALGIVNRLDVDLCIVGRGGGAREDLAAFNDEQVCRALAALRVPSISAVGHETDVSLCDLVADVRAATPSNAAELAVPALDAVLHRLDALGDRLAGGLTRRTRLAAERLERSADRMQYAVEQRLGGLRAALDRTAAQLDALSPLRVLARGYAMPTDDGGRVLKRRADFTPGLDFNLRVSDGDVRARAE